ncbi:hypothetical protein Glove_551g49 [Diversispora epigaea]|uniref:C2H2-type domain-containing protein n=1 Tax=Diversispora epigaea TaxID=1348612 RepID=A0A397GBU9_9GLOM|nr:hypothetical protein Glove_551g49 [Diversispora epigaea]
MVHTFLINDLHYIPHENFRNLLECYSITSPQLCNIMQELQIKFSDNHGESSKSFTILNQGTFENGPECHSMTLPQFYKRSNEAQCLWATCAAVFRSIDELIPHLSRLHVAGRSKENL